MPRHYHNETYHHQVRFIKRARRLVGALIILALITAAVIGIDSLIQDQESSVPSQSTLAQTATYSPQVNIFRTPYFQFQTGGTWSEVANQTNPNTYIYRSLRGALIEHELTIYVNRPEENIGATYVLPVNTTSSGELLPLQVSEHCSKAVAGQANSGPQVVTVERVRLYCLADSTHYTVVVGTVDGTPNLVLSRPDGSTARYNIEYRNLTASPEVTHLYQIVDSFQTR